MIHGVISDVHSNLEALRAVLSELDNVDDIWFLGDAVGYGPDPTECFDQLSSACRIVLAGNHDLGAIEVISLETFNPIAAIACEYSARALPETAKMRLGELPSTAEVDGPIALAHGSLIDPVWEYVFSPAVADRSFAHSAFDILFVGHTHFPAVFAKKRDGRPVLMAFEQDAAVSLAEPGSRYIVNPGGVGQPRDGDPTAPYCVFDDEARTVTLHRVTYPIQTTQRKMLEAGLPAKLAERLSYGM